MSIVQYVSSKLNIKSDCVEFERQPDLPRVCPGCNGKLIGAGSYWRQIILEKFLDRVFWIRIRRVCCKNCGVTHAALPHLLTPYQRFVTNVYRQVVKERALGATMRYLAQKFCVSEDTVRRWVRRAVGGPLQFAEHVE
jgi:transposase